MNYPFACFLRGSSLRFAGLGLLLLAACNTVPPFMTTVSPPVPLWANGAPGAKGSTEADQPALIPFLPTGASTGASIVIVPDGADSPSVASGDPAELARWLNAQGATVFVLRRRGAAYDAAASQADVNRAVQYVRAHAADYKVSEKRIALLGFAKGAELVADTVFNHSLAAKTDSADSVEKVSARPDFLGLVWGATVPAAAPAGAPPTFLIGSSSTADNMTAVYDVWEKLRAARVPVDMHLFARADEKSGLAADNPSLSTWPDMFHRWALNKGWGTDAPRLTVKGMVMLDGRPIPHGYVIFTPVDSPGAGPIVGHVLNSDANQTIGSFNIPAAIGPVAGRYRVDVRQNMNRWLSNSFSGNLVGGRGPATPERTYFGHYRVLAPSITDQRSFTKQRPSDAGDYIVEIKPGADATNLNIEVFSK